jgi:hypothetical protein
MGNLMMFDTLQKWKRNSTHLYLSTLARFETRLRACETLEDIKALINHLLNLNKHQIKTEICYNRDRTKKKILNL